MANESNEQPIDLLSEEQAPVQIPQGELWVKDVNETGRWGNRSRREIYCAVTIILMMIVATITGVVVAVKKSNKNDSTEPVGLTKVDPITGETVSAYELPVKPAPTIITDQEELDMILSELSSNSILSDKVSAIPNTVAALASTSSADPFTQAASWLTNVDATNAKEDVISRFALAVVFYTTNGTSWTNATNWLSSEYHCNWFGVSCCDNMIGVAVCRPDSFGQIVELDLYKNNLVGPIPTSVVLLSSLHVMYLSKNGLTGSLPGQALASMKNFAKLYAQYNYLTGTIPSELANLTTLSKCYCLDFVCTIVQCRRK
jgi:hypothetical protein